MSMLKKTASSEEKLQTGPRVYDEMRRMAIGYDFKPNERINEMELAARFGVSRTPVREALNRLVIEGLMTFQPNRGFFCRGFDAEEIVHLSEVRAMLEEHAVRLAAANATEGSLRGLADWWQLSSARADALSSRDLTDMDEEFHRRIAGLSGNPELSKMLESINTCIRFVREIEVEASRRLSTTYEEHRAIAAALGVRDGEQAARLMREHIAVSVADAVASVKEGLARIYMRARPAP